MKKYLLGIILLLIWTGVDKVRGQYVADVTYTKVQFCEDEKDGAGAVLVTVTIKFKVSEGSSTDGTYSFKYTYNSQTSSVNNHASEDWSQELPFYDSDQIIISDFYFVPNGGGDDVQGTINNGSTDIQIDLIPTPIINDPIRTCDLDVYLSTTKEFDSSSVLWRMENPDHDIYLSDPTLVNPVFSAPAEDDYNVYVTEIHGECRTEVMKTIPAVYSASPSGGPVSNSEIICSGTQATIDLDLNGTFPITVQYEDGSTLFSETDQHQITTRILTDNESYNISRLIDTNGCETDINDPVAIQVDFVPIANAGDDISECSNTVALSASINDNITGQWFFESAPDYLSDPTSPTSQFTVPLNLQKTKEEFELVWRATNKDNEECFSEDLVKVKLNKVPESEILTDISKLYLAKELELEAVTIPNGMIGVWEVVESPSQSPDIITPNNNVTMVEDLVTGNYSFRWTVSNGDICPAPHDILNITNEDIYRTTGFSPNNDGVNDTFIIGGAENVSNSKLVIFDITGEVVFEVENFCHAGTTTEGGWDGTQKNGEKKDGTYYYIFTGNEIDPVKNYLIIKGSRE